MRKWTGYHDEQVPIGDDVDAAINVSYRERGALRRRYGLGTRLALNVDSLGALTTSANSYLVGNNAGTLVAYDLDANTTANVKTGLASTPRGVFANAGGKLYFTNGTDAIVAIAAGTGTAPNAGIAAPAGAPTAGAPGAGSVTAGVHRIRYRYKDSTSGYYSNPSPELEFTAAGSQNIPLTLVTSADAKVDQQVIEMTLAAGSDFYVVATISQATSYTINLSDLTLQAQQRTSVFAFPDGYGHEPPPTGYPLMCEHRGRIFLWGNLTSQELRWSRALYPEAFNAFDWARKVAIGRSDTPAAIIGFQNDLYLLGRMSMRRFIYDSDPAAAMLITLPTNLGAYNQRCVVQADGSLYGIGPTGAWMIDGIHPTHISRPIDRTFKADVDESKSERFHAVYDPSERVILFFYVPTGGTNPTRALCYDTMTGEWSRRTFQHGLVASIQVGDATRAPAAYVADDDGGYTWALTADRFDGVPSTLTSGVVTSTGASTTTVITVSQSLPTSGQTLVGAFLATEDLTEVRRITANTANTITVASAFSSAPTNGQELWIGAIDVDLLSDWTIAGSLNRTMSPARLQVDDLNENTDPVVYRVSMFQDFSATKTPLTIQSVDDTAPRGITIDDGDALVDTSVTGPTVPVSLSDAKCVRWRLRQQRPAGTMRLLDVAWQFERGPTEERAE